MPAATPPVPPRSEADNRRNHYRVLHVQPEAPVEVIKASYRTLMTRLKGHPDLGGSHAHAAMINEAWQVLGDPVRRAAYDKQLRRRGPPPPRAGAGPGAAAQAAQAGQPGQTGKGAGGFTPGTAAGVPRGRSAGAGAGFQPFQASGAAAQPAAGGGARPGAAPSPAAASASPPGQPAAGAAAPPGARTAPGAASAAAAAATGAASGGASGAVPGASPGPRPAAPSTALSLPPLVQPAHHCPLCGQVSLADPRPDSRCLRCHAPLAALPAPGSPGHELLGRRGAARREQQHVAMLRVGWPSPELPVRWRDLSLTGLSLFTPQALAPGQRIHVLDQALEAVAEVIVSRPQGRLFTVHARLVSALLLQSTGVFVSAQA